MTHRVLLLTGSRDAAPSVVFNALNQARTSSGPMVLRHGACRKGADAIGASWARQHRQVGVTEDPMPADWKTHGNPAGFIRNAEMVAKGADLCVAVIYLCDKPRCSQRGLHGSHGSMHAAKLADEADIPVVAYVMTPGTRAIVRITTGPESPRLSVLLDRLYGQVTS